MYGSAQSTPVQQSALTPEQARDAAGHLQPPVVRASAPAEMPRSEHGASPHAAADATAQKPVSAGQQQAPRPDQPAVLGTAMPEEAPADAAPAQPAPPACKTGKRRSTISGKSLTAQPEPTRLPGPDTQKPRTRRQTMAAAGHASGPLARTPQAGPDDIIRMAPGSFRPTSRKENGPDKVVAASHEVGPRARQARRASAATARKEVGCVPEQLPCGRPKRRRGASMAAAPDQAAAAVAEALPSVTGVLGTTKLPSEAAIRDQVVAQIGPAFAFPAPISLNTITEDVEEEEEGESQKEEKAGLPCTAADGSARKQSRKQSTRSSATESAQQPQLHPACEAPVQNVQGPSRQMAKGREQHCSAVHAAGGASKQASEVADQRLPASRGCQTSTVNGGREEGPVRRSARRAVLTARPCSAHRQPACPHPASPEVDHAAASAGSVAAVYTCAVHCIL